MHVQLNTSSDFNYNSPDIVDRVPLKPLNGQTLTDVTAVARARLRKREDSDSDNENRQYPPRKCPRQTISVPADGIAFVAQSEEVKKAGEVKDDDIVMHAKLRMEMFALAVTFFRALAVSSNGNLYEGLEMRRCPAYLQIGKGTSAPKEPGKKAVRYHAAHANATAGLEDNYLATAVDRAMRLGLTDKTRRVLELKGFTFEEIKALEQHDEQFANVLETFYKRQGVDTKRPHSLLSGTNLERILNFTTEVHWIVNMWVDKSLENAIREGAFDLYRQVWRNEITREAACDAYNNLILSQFTESVSKLDWRLHLLEGYSNTFDELLKYNELDHQSLENVVADLKSKKKALFKTGCSDASSIDTRRNLQFLTHLDSMLRQKNEGIIASTGVWLSKNFYSLKNQLSNAKKQLGDYVKFSRLELVGTQLPELTSLFDEVDAEGYLTPNQALLLAPAPSTPMKATKSESGYDRTQLVRMKALGQQCFKSIGTALAEPSHNQIPCFIDNEHMPYSLPATPIAATPTTPLKRPHAQFVGERPVQPISFPLLLKV